MTANTAALSNDGVVQSLLLATVPSVIQGHLPARREQGRLRGALRSFHPPTSAPDAV